MFTQSLRQLVALIVISFVVAGSGCMTRHDSALSVRPASDCPDHFLAKQPNVPAPSDAARSPMLDPRDGTQLTLVRSNLGWGDYEVPSGRYGVKPGEVLRLEASTGRVIGIVKN